MVYVKPLAQCAAHCEGPAHGNDWQGGDGAGDREGDDDEGEDDGKNDADGDGGDVSDSFRLSEAPCLQALKRIR